MNINVLFELPEEIARGLANGTLERVGGVIRRTVDKKIVLWLTEIGKGELQKDGLPSILSSPQMLLGMQVANLAVNVAGFALIYQKIQQVERQLHSIDEKLVTLVEGQKWLDKKQLIVQLAPVVNSMNTLESVHRIKDKVLAREKLILADDRLGEASVYFRQIVGRMLADKLEQEHPDEFAACYRAWLMASQGRIQAMAEMDEIPEAFARADAFKLEHQAFGRDFIEVRSNPLRKLANERAQSYAEPLLTRLGRQCAGAHEIIKGKALQLEFMKDSGLKVSDLPDFRDISNKQYALVCFK